MQGPRLRRFLPHKKPTPDHGHAATARPTHLAATPPPRRPEARPRSCAPGCAAPAASCALSRGASKTPKRGPQRPQSRGHPGGKRICSDVLALSEGTSHPRSLANTVLRAPSGWIRRDFSGAAHFLQFLTGFCIFSTGFLWVLVITGVRHACFLFCSGPAWGGFAQLCPKKEGFLSVFDRFFEFCTKSKTLPIGHFWRRPNFFPCIGGS